VRCVLWGDAVCCSLSQCVAVCCSVCQSECVAVRVCDEEGYRVVVDEVRCCGVLQRVADVSQCVAACSSVLQSGCCDVSAWCGDGIVLWCMRCVAVVCCGVCLAVWGVWIGVAAGVLQLCCRWCVASVLQCVLQVCC